MIGLPSVLRVYARTKSLPRFPIRALMALALCLVLCAPVWAVEEADPSPSQGSQTPQAPQGSVAEAEQAVMRKDYVAARQLLEAPAREGDATAEDMLGHMLLFGRGGPVDSTRAEELLRRAADKGRPEAQNSMGVLYMTGINGTIDPKQGIEWFRKAADNGHAYAMFNLGRASEQGLGMKKSKTEASAWYARAAAKGSEAAKIRLAELKGTPVRGENDMAYKLNATGSASSTGSSQLPPLGASLKPDGEQKSARTGEQAFPEIIKPEIRNLRIEREARDVTLRFKLTNSEDRGVCRGDLHFILLAPDNTRTPLDAPESDFRCRAYVNKKLTLLLPQSTPEGSSILIEARHGEELLLSERVALPKP